MELSTRTLVKIALFTRRFTRYGSPFAYRLCRRLLHMIYGPKKRRPPERIVMDYDEGQMSLDTSSLVDYRILFHGYYEPEIIRLIKRVIRPGSVCLDIGANIGSHTLVMAFAAGSGGRIVAVEPHPQVARRLLENVALNGLENVAVVIAALSDKDGVATLYAYEESEFVRGTSSLRPSQTAGQQIEVRTICGRTLQKEVGLTRCDLIKIDVEGSEMMALRQLSDLIGRSRPFLIFEYRRKLWDTFGAAIGEAMELLCGWDYDLYFEKDDITRPLELETPEACNIVCVPTGREEKILCA